MSKRSTLLTVAGILTILTALIMLYYGFGFLSAYISSTNYYNTRIFEPALYIGIWCSCAFPLTLTGAIFLLKKKHLRFSIFGILLALISGFVPLLVFAVIHGYATNGLDVGAPLIFFSTISLAFTFLGQRKRIQVTPNQ